MGTCHVMGGHRSLLMGMVLVWVQIRRKCWGLCFLSKTLLAHLVSEPILKIGETFGTFISHSQIVRDSMI